MSILLSLYVAIRQLTDRPLGQHQPVCQGASVFRYHQQYASEWSSLALAFLEQCRTSDFLVTTDNNTHQLERLHIILNFRKIYNPN